VNHALLAARTQRPLAELKEKGRLKRVAVGVRSFSAWTGPEEAEIGGEKVRVVWCRSLLEMRENISAPRVLPLIVVTSVDDNKLADDLRARLFKRRLLNVDIWDVLRERFGAHSVDPRLRRDPILGEALVECLGGDRNAPPVPSGVLHEDAAWEFVLRQMLGLSSSRPEPADLLEWIGEPAIADRFSRLEPRLRQRISEWLIAQRGLLADALLTCLNAGAGSEAFAVGLALQALTEKSVPDADRLEQMRALGRMERFTVNRPISVEVAKTWFDAADELATRRIQHGRALEIRTTAEQADRILETSGAGPLARFSRWSPFGGRQLLDDLGTAMLPMPRDTARLEANLDGLKQRHWFESDRPVLDRVAMGLRLLRWLATPVRKASEFTSAAEAYAAEGSWVDWARYKIRAGSPSGPLAAALQKIGGEVQARREAEDERFGRLIREWTRGGISLSRIIAVERLIETYIADIDLNKNPLLVVIMDGMSYAVARELERDFPAARWIPRSPDGRELPPAVAALPSVTQVSRYSLLAGKLGTGAQNAEVRDFTANPAFRNAGEPVLFHKSDLASLGDLSTSPVIQKIADSKQRVVGVVINAVDDQLGGADQLNQEWSLEYLPVLRILLAEAATAQRVVILTSDHGHKLDLQYGGNPRAPHHGGATPQECLVPVYVLAVPSAELPKWKEVPATQPEWWEPSAKPTAAPVLAPSPSKRRKAQPSLFATEPDWIDRLLASGVFEEQMSLAGKRLQPEAVVNALRALDGGGGRLLKTAFAQRMNLPLIRVGTFVAALQGVLNVDGYAVLKLDEASQTVALDRGLLDRQFNLL